ncbi:MAG: ABC transporter ATP-binding protein/permease [Granulosicoccus sp.]|nr:ABC transporter ATP-binding protein/permease [Granulosicoccus sp.]
MLQSLCRFVTLCSAQDIRRLWVLLALVLTTGILAVAGIASVVPFLQLAADPQAATENQLVQRLFDALNLESRSAKLMVVGWAVIVFLGVSNLLTLLAQWQTQRIAWTIAHHVSVFLAASYARLPYDYYLYRESGDIIKSVIDDVNRLVDGVVVAGCRLITQVIVSTMILVLLFYINPFVALTSIGVFFGPYLIMTYLRRAYLTDLGRERLLANSRRFITFSDLIVGIKAIKSAEADEYFVNRFEKPSRVFSQVQPKIYVSAATPRYVLESVAFGAVVAVIMYLSNRSTDLVSVIPTLTLFTLAGYRLMPAAQQGYQAMVQLLSNYPAIDNIYFDVQSQVSGKEQQLIGSRRNKSTTESGALAATRENPRWRNTAGATSETAKIANTKDKSAESAVATEGVSATDREVQNFNAQATVLTHSTQFNVSQGIDFTQSISMRDLSFAFGPDEPRVLKEISLDILKGQRVGFVGPSGSGKTTLIDIVVGLLQPSSGELFIDNCPIDQSRTTAVKKLIGYVPQDVFLYNDTIARNIAFGVHDVDMPRVMRCCTLARLSQVIEQELVDGYDTVIGERGLRLSGGQRQRIGLARALYRMPQILVLDEATSALDTVTEKSVMSAIVNELPDVTIIIIAHRLSTVRDCDRLFVLDRGNLVAQGSYEELLSNSSLFQEMASIG